MTEQELREKIAEKICCLYPQECNNCKRGKGCPDEWSDITERVDNIRAFFRGYVKLAEDQGDLYEMLTEDFVEPAANFYVSDNNRQHFFDLWRQFKKPLAGYVKLEGKE